jgi:hypothetical protein
MFRDGYLELILLRFILAEMETVLVRYRSETVPVRAAATHRLQGFCRFLRNGRAAFTVLGLKVSSRWLESEARLSLQGTWSARDGPVACRETPRLSMRGSLGSGLCGRHPGINGGGERGCENPC